MYINESYNNFFEFFLKTLKKITATKNQFKSVPNNATFFSSRQQEPSSAGNDYKVVPAPLGAARLIAAFKMRGKTGKRAAVSPTTRGGLFPRYVQGMEARPGVRRGKRNQINGILLSSRATTSLFRCFRCFVAYF